MVDISVLMAVHNESTELIACAIQSIMNQSMQTFELILCDDASNLVVSQYLKKIQMSDDRIHLLRSDENLYAGKTRNMGLKVAKGRYIAILDADDYSYPDRLKIQYEFLESHSQYAFVCSDADIYDGKNTLPSQYKLKSDPEKEDFLWGNAFCPCNCDDQESMYGSSWWICRDKSKSTFRGLRFIYAIICVGL